MYEKITIAQAVRILLDEGYVCEICLHHCKTRKYTVHRRLNLGDVNKITPKQFEELAGANLIECTSSRPDKYGNIYNYFEIVR